MAQSLADVLSAFTPEQRARVEARAQERIEEGEFQPSSGGVFIG